MPRTSGIQSAILKLLEKEHILSPVQLQEKLAVNKTSIYRALEKLEAEGKICKQIFGDDQLMYELRGDHHDHLVCENCGRVENIDCSTVSPKETLGFIISHHHTTFFGICTDCKNS